MDTAIGPSFFSDQPIRSKSEDRFNRATFAKRVADTLATRPETSSLVVGLYGPWGDGKTSTIALIEEALKQHKGVVALQFNPWYFDNQEQLIRGFFTMLAEALGGSLSTRREELGAVLKRYGGILSLASVGLADGVIRISPGAAVKDLGEALSTVELDTLRARLESILRESKICVVVLIDDIDRLDREEIHALFKLVKLSAGFERISYVLAFDDDIVAASLGQKYGQGDIAAGRSFLEKIIQVPLRLPPADGILLRKMTFEGVDKALKTSAIDLSQEQVEAFVRYFVDGLEPLLKTPRQARLYANAVTFALPILKGEVNPVDQMLIEGIRIFLPTLYPMIRSNPDLFTPSAFDRQHNRDFLERVQTAVDNALGGLSKSDRERIQTRLLEVMFPRISNMGYGSDWDEQWAKEKRICSREYFARYFGYGVPPGDVSDTVVEEFLSAFGTKPAAEIDAQFQAFGKDNTIPKVIQKLRLKEDNISPPKSEELARVIARNAAVLPRERAMLMSDMTTMQAAILIKNLVHQTIDATAREAIARDLIVVSQTVYFASECFRWFRKSDDTPEEDRLVSAEAEIRLGLQLAARIRDATAEGPLWRVHGEDTPRLLWVWNKYGEEGEVGRYIHKQIQSDPSEVDVFLDTFVGTAWGVESGLPHRSDFDRDGYNAIARLIDPELIAAALRKKYGTELDQPVYHQNRDVPLARRIAHQFIHVHNVAKSESSIAQGTHPDGESATT